MTMVLTYLHAFFFETIFPGMSSVGTSFHGGQVLKTAGKREQLHTARITSNSKNGIKDHDDALRAFVFFSSDFTKSKILQVRI